MVYKRTVRIQSVVTKVTITGQTRTTGNPRKHVTPEIRKAADDAFDVHTVLDTVGFVPVVGEPADLVNGLIYAAEKDYINAGISMAAVIPVIGEAGKAVKYGAKAVDKGGEIAKIFNVVSKPLSKKESKTFRIVANGIEFEEVLNSLLRINKIDVYVTGSNSRFLSSDIVTEFRGRGDEVRIYQLSFSEFYSAYDGEYDDAWNGYMTYGGLPQTAVLRSERQKAEYLKNIFSNVYLKDVVERNHIQNKEELGTLVDILASAIGAPTNPTKISNTFASECRTNYTNKTISRHIDYLEEAFLISKASRYDIKGRKYSGFL